MNFRVLMLFCLITLFLLLMTPIAIAADDDEEDDQEDPWGDAAIDHKLNAGWDYPSDYIAQPLNYSKRVTEFGFGFSQMSSRHYYDDNSELVEGSFRSRKQVFEFFLGMGFSDNWSIAVTFPFVYKKTKILEGNQNYRNGGDNTYGYLFEESFVDYLTNHEIWKLWEADLPQLGDVRLWTCYSLYRKLDPRTTSLILEVEAKFPTGNDNLRRGGEVRNFVTTGNTDTYIGLGFKQEAWKFAFEIHGGYNWRLPANTKYSAGEIDFGDQVLADGEVVFEIPAAEPLWSELNIAAFFHYMGRYENVSLGDRDIMNTYVEDNLGNEVKLDDAPASLLSVGPKLVWQHDWLSKLFDELSFEMDIPIAGQNSFLVPSHSLYLPPWELESYEGVGITYSIGLLKRWQ